MVFLRQRMLHVANGLARHQLQGGSLVVRTNNDGEYEQRQNSKLRYVADTMEEEARLHED